MFCFHLNVHYFEVLRGEVKKKVFFSSRLIIHFHYGQTKKVAFSLFYFIFSQFNLLHFTTNHCNKMTKKKKILQSALDNRKR